MTNGDQDLSTRECLRQLAATARTIEERRLFNELARSQAVFESAIHGLHAARLTPPAPVVRGVSTASVPGVAVE